MLVRIIPFVFVCLWATGFIGARMGMPYSEPGTFLGLRFAIAFFLLVTIALILNAPWPGLKPALQSVLIGSLIHGMYLGPVFWAIDRGMPAGVSAVVVGMQPLLTALLAGWWLKEVITRNHLYGLVLGITGVCLVLYPGLNLSDGGVNLTTISVTLLGAASVTLGTVMQKTVSSTTDLRSGTALQYLGAFIPMMALAMLTETGTIYWGFESIFAMVWLVLILSVVAIFLLMWLIQEGSVAKVSSLFFLVPGVAALIAYFLFDETLVPIQLLGMAICAVAVALAVYSKPHSA